MRAIQASTVNNNNLVRPTIHRQLASHCPPTSSFVKMCLLNVRSLSNKTLICHDLILSSNTDFFMLTETWLRPGDNVPLNETCPSNFSYFNLPRPVKRGGGLAVFYKICINVLPCPLEILLPLKSFVFKLTVRTQFSVF